MESGRPELPTDPARPVGARAATNSTYSPSLRVRLSTGRGCASTPFTDTGCAERLELRDRLRWRSELRAFPAGPEERAAQDGLSGVTLRQEGTQDEDARRSAHVPRWRRAAMAQRVGERHEVIWWGLTFGHWVDAIPTAPEALSHLGIGVPLTGGRGKAEVQAEPIAPARVTSGMYGPDSSDHERTG